MSRLLIAQKIGKISIVLLGFHKFDFKAFYTFPELVDLELNI